MCKFSIKMFDTSRIEVIINSDIHGYKQKQLVWSILPRNDKFYNSFKIIHPHAFVSQAVNRMKRSVDGKVYRTDDALSTGFLNVMLDRKFRELKITKKDVIEIRNALIPYVGALEFIEN